MEYDKVTDIYSYETLYETKYSKKDRVKLVKDCL